ncbi:hypothetical protein O181_003105 [Austropuccinia psidii MF-1]|uniref:Uncharacterized protein n=1 Tax=Austropuccinia psidii MF-1 TaxID=1389203 RepID=A0A9Q3GDJ3_9BASI|nr:hypothetical protein [Austropuccinia psidii MF-1]
MGKTPAIFKKGWNPKLPEDTLRNDLIDINATASDLEIMLDKAKNYEKQRINDALDYAKHKWEKSHKVPELKVGDLVPVSNMSLHNIKGPKKLKYSYVGPFFIFFLHVTNEVQVELSGGLENKHPSFPLSLMKPYQPAENKLFPLRHQLL